MPTATVNDVTDATFGTEVIESSRSMPVVVDFWAPWCGPCKQLGPLIEKLAGEFAGKVKVLKLNTDENPRAAQAFQIQSIPAVKAFVDGKVAAEFLGAQPEANVRAFFKGLAPTEEDILLERAYEALDREDVAAAEQLFRLILDKQRDHPDAIVGLASILVDRGEREEADKLLARAEHNRQVKAFKHLLFLDDFAEKHQDEDLEGEARANPADPRARYRWGLMLAAHERFDEALDELLASVRLDRKFEDDAARKGALAVFDILGPEEPMTRQYQRKLSQLLF